ncbi:MAG: aspartate--tRNA ligase [Solirubrobacterales bacterium]|nr:MAG: aspartate--tRNA ligase [Solirubrobacterales bacterium]
MKQPPRPNRYRDTWCGAPDLQMAGERIAVAGWVHRRRDHGGLIFIDLRDRSGLLQLVFRPDFAEAHGAAHRLRSEDVVSVTGTLTGREPENVNRELSTGAVELVVESFKLLATSATPPFPIDSDGPVDESLRLRHRAIDLRRASPLSALELRHDVIATIRAELDARDFIAVETPLLTRSTPEGARDFLVPVRAPRGAFYALPQSPQLFKQLLMVGGIERYYQIARCFRDEPSRADRQPEFTQLDLEMSFVEEDDVIELMEAVMAAVFAVGGMADAIGPPPWPRLSYDEALLRYGSDSPDTRFDLEIVEVSEALASTEARVFAAALGSGGVVRAINAGARELPRSELDALVELARELGAKGLAYAFIEEGGGWRSPIAKFISESEREAVTTALDARPGDLLFFVADSAQVTARALGGLRLELSRRFGLLSGAGHRALWMTDFPMFERDPQTGHWDPLHHPFTAPVGDLDDPASLRSRAYDLVVDGSEIGGGSIRTHCPEVLRRVLELVGIAPDEAQERFGFLIDALAYGAPPHGGIAMGLDRIVAILAGAPSIRDVIAFPKTVSAMDPLTGAPAPVDTQQLRELGLRVDLKG